MAEPVAFVSHFRIKEGGLDRYLDLQREVAPRLEAEKPRTLVFLIFLDDSGSEMTALHVFADAESMDAHFERSDERAAAAYQFLEPKGWEFYGRPSEAAMETMRRTAAAAGVPLTVHPRYTAGFIRPRPTTPPDG